VIEHADGATTPVIDASVHIFSKSNKDLRSFLREPFKSRGFPGLRDGLVRALLAASTHRIPRGRIANIPVQTPSLSAGSCSTSEGVDVRDPAPDDPGHHARPAPWHRDRGRAQTS